jgi:hypothetical protein
MSKRVRLFWWLVLIFATSCAVAVVSWTASELVTGVDARMDRSLNEAMVIAFVTALASAILLAIIGPAVFHDRFRQTRTPPDGTMTPG